MDNVDVYQVHVDHARVLGSTGAWIWMWLWYVLALLRSCPVLSCPVPSFMFCVLRCERGALGRRGLDACPADLW